MRHLHEYWSSVAYQGYSLPATAIAESIMSAASYYGGTSGQGGGEGGGDCQCKVTVTSNLEVGGIKSGRRYNEAPVADVIKDLLTTTIPSTISLTYSPTTVVESGVPTIYTFTTHPTNGTDAIVKQTVTFPDGSVEEFDNGSSQTFTKELTIIDSIKVTVKGETANKQTSTGEATLKAYLPMFYGTSEDTRTEEEVRQEVDGPNTLEEEDVLKLNKIVKSTDYTGTYNFDTKDSYKWIWFYLPKSSNIDMTKAKSGEYQFPCTSPVEQVININGVNQIYRCFRSGDSQNDEEIFPVTLY